MTSWIARRHVAVIADPERIGHSPPFFPSRRSRVSPCGDGQGGRIACDVFASDGGAAPWLRNLP